MHIGINLLYLLPGVVGGTQTYAQGLLDGLAAIDHENQYTIFVNLEAADLPLPAAPNFQRVVCPVQARRRSVRYAYEQIILPLQLFRRRIDLVHSLGYVGPLVTPCPAVVTLPDLNFIALRDLPDMIGTRGWVLEFFAVQAARHARHVITISEFSKTEIVRYLGLPAEKISATLLGAGTLNDAPNENWPGLQQQYQLPAHYVAAFGGGYAHKNIPRLIQAFARISGDIPHSLVLIGRLPPGVDAEQLAAASGLAGRVLALNYLPKSHVKAVLSHADLFVLPSLYEGFGLTVLEAQSCGVAVACSRVASIPEVAGEGAAYFDPQSVEDMANVIRACLLDTDRRSALIAHGQENLKRFSWEKTARETLAIYQRFDGTR